MPDTKENSYVRLYILFVFLVAVLFIFDLVIGSTKIPLSDFYHLVFGGEEVDEVKRKIILDFRLPRAITSLLAGASLGMAGLMMQTLFRNPLAGPFVLGISSGASLGVAILVLATAGSGAFFFSVPLTGWNTIMASSLGASVVLTLVMMISLKMRDTVSLLIIGIMLGSLTGAIVSALQYFSNAEQIQVYLMWTFGSLGKVTWAEMVYFIPVLLGGIAITLTQYKQLNTLLMGEEYAKSMGLNLRLTRSLVVILTSILAGTVTAFCGPIAFVGLAAPHAARILIRNGDHRVLSPTTILTGIIIMLFCDIISQLPGSAWVLPINIVTSLLGAPVVIWLIFRSRGLKGIF